MIIAAKTATGDPGAAESLEKQVWMCRSRRSNLPLPLECEIIVLRRVIVRHGG